MKSRAKAFFDQIASLGPVERSAFLANMVTEKRPETGFLDFIGAGRASEQSIKENWSKALSGFANTEGGVLVWGIRAAGVQRPGAAKKIDAADSLDLAPNAYDLSQTLKNVLLEATIDPVAGVQIEPCPEKAGSNSGFVVCLIPEGRHKPYRAELDEHQQYYQRITDRFVSIPHSLLRSLFYPQVSATFRASAEFTWDRDPDAKPVLKCVLKIKNSGNGTAKGVYVIVTSDNNNIVDNREGAMWSPSAVSGSYAFEAMRSLHPRFNCRLWALTFRVETENVYGGTGGFRLPAKIPTLELTVYSENQLPQTLALAPTETHMDRLRVAPTCTVESSVSSALELP